MFSGVDKIIRGPLAEADLDEVRGLFGVKFWGSFVVGKGILSSISYMYFTGTAI